MLFKPHLLNRVKFESTDDKVKTTTGSTTINQLAPSAWKRRQQINIKESAARKRESAWSAVRRHALATDKGQGGGSREEQARHSFVEKNILQLITVSPCDRAR